MREETIRDVEQFLYREARLLDERRFHEWLELFTEDVRYWTAGRRNRYPKSSKAIAILDLDRYIEEEETEDVGARRDVLRLVDGAWKIANRKLILDQNVLLAKNVSIFF
jgi:3-phenylpropionate/cinnamic acid dioxygenase small subunit